MEDFWNPSFHIEKKGTRQELIPQNIKISDCVKSPCKILIHFLHFLSGTDRNFPPKQNMKQIKVDDAG